MHSDFIDFEIFRGFFGWSPPIVIAIKLIEFLPVFFSRPVSTAQLRRNKTKQAMFSTNNKQIVRWTQQKHNK